MTTNVDITDFWSFVLDNHWSKIRDKQPMDDDGGWDKLRYGRGLLAPRVVSSSELARAVIPSAFFVCFVTSCFANTNMPLVTDTSIQQRQALKSPHPYSKSNCFLCGFCQNCFANTNQYLKIHKTKSSNELVHDQWSPVCFLCVSCFYRVVFFTGPP